MRAYVHQPDMRLAQTSLSLPTPARRQNSFNADLKMRYSLFGSAWRDLLLLSGAVENHSVD